MSPIRSNRGHSAVWRSMWAWSLHNRTRAVITVLGVVGVLVLIGQLTQWGRGDEVAAPPPAAVSPTVRPADPAPAIETSMEPIPAPSSPVTAMGLPAPQEALRAAKGFMINWVNHPEGMPATTWADNLAPYAMPEFSGRLYSTEPGNVPATRIIGDPQVTRVTDAVVEIDFRTDGDTVHVTLIHPTGPWLVNRLGVAQ